MPSVFADLAAKTKYGLRMKGVKNIMNAALMTREEARRYLAQDIRSPNITPETRAKLIMVDAKLGGYDVPEAKPEPLMLPGGRREAALLELGRAHRYEMLQKQKAITVVAKEIPTNGTTQTAAQRAG